MELWCRGSEGEFLLALTAPVDCPRGPVYVPFLAGDGQHVFAALRVIQSRVRAEVPVMAVAGNGLAVPVQIAGRGIERDYGVGLEIRLLRGPLHVVRKRIRDGPEQLAGGRIERIAGPEGTPAGVEPPSSGDGQVSAFFSMPMGMVWKRQSSLPVTASKAMSRPRTPRSAVTMPRKTFRSRRSVPGEGLVAGGIGGLRLPEQVAERRMGSPPVGRHCRKM